MTDASVRAVSDHSGRIRGSASWDGKSEKMAFAKPRAIIAQSTEGIPTVQMENTRVRENCQLEDPYQKDPSLRLKNDAFPWPSHRSGMI